MTAALRRLPPADREALHARRVARAERFAPLNPHERRRLLRGASGAALTAFAVGVFLSLFLPFPSGREHVLHPPFAAAAGALVAWRRISPPVGTALFATLAGALYALSGRPLVTFAGLYAVFAGCLVGLLVGLDEDLRQGDDP